MNKKGFTLMEVMIVIFIIAILVAAAVPSYIDNLKKTRNQEAAVALQKAGQANKTFLSQYPGKYITGTVTNAVNTGTTVACNPSGGTPAVLFQCGYLVKDNWDSYAYYICVCNPSSGIPTSGNGCCCKAGWFATMTMRGATNNYCAYIDANGEFGENVAYDKAQ